MEKLPGLIAATIDPGDIHWTEIPVCLSPLDSLTVRMSASEISVPIPNVELVDLLITNVNTAWWSVLKSVV